jgi:conjugal transfer pilus assembly protein TraF
MMQRLEKSLSKMLVSTILCFGLPTISTAERPKDSFFQKHAEGWHWYQDSHQKSIISNQKGKNQTPSEMIEQQRKELEKKLHTAIIEPTRENLIAYITFQRKIFDQSERFSNSWKEVVMTTPSLDETLKHPVDQNARHVYYDLKHKDLKSRIQVLSKEYGLFFFFKKDCPYCHRFAPIVKHFAASHGWSVLAVSLDGGTLPEFPDTKRDNGIASRLNITHVPALIALHPQSGKFIPLAYGMISESEIEARVELLTKLNSGENK